MSFLPRHPNGPVHINFSVTERCNRACPDCCYGIHILHPNVWEIGLDELAKSAQLIGPMDRVVLTGGEPSFHRQFLEVAQVARQNFHCHTLAIETNAYAFKRQPEAWLIFDEIQVTHYRSDTYAKSPPNDDEITFMRGYLDGRGARTRLVVREIDPHFVRKVHANPVMCARGWNGYVTYFKGRVYGCCAAQGVEGAEGIVLSPHWRSEIMAADLPCGKCLFAGPC